ncbi:putative endonuclease [Sporomusaceae bacterium BoRhaA]|uniref:YraN family protein n=1 Tax=Pelorhabdus rhamnosifermentans TaxID=2772457 RepID=UPI001C05F7B8|nr:YraN family protein [Pelorhabdus rhamnosifermentans]MBU2701234.1 putative endonuclease [Pelorhabdus rhamnosifermentans]
MNHITFGMWGEARARSFLFQKGYKILTSHYRLKIGEIDIIAQDGDIIVFVEVKTRRNDDYGTPAEAVNFRKQRKIKMTALSYLQRFSLQEQPVRFDVIEVYGTGGKQSNIHHIINAFGGT